MQPAMRPVRIERVMTIRHGSRLTVADKFFNVFCSFHGLIISPTLRRRLGTALMVFWIVLLALQWVLLLWYLELLLGDPMESASLLEIVISVANFIDVVASSYIVFSFFRKRTVIQSLLRMRGRKFKDVFMLLLYAIPAISMQSYKAIRAIQTPVTAFSLSSASFVETTMACFLVVYADLLATLMKCNSQLCTLCKDSGKTLDELAAAKWDLRYKIDAVNEFSSLPLVSHYVKMIKNVLFVFVMVLGQFRSGIDLIVLVAYSAGHIFTMYYLAWKTSRLDVQRGVQAQDLLMRISIQSAEAIVAERVFKFRRDLDVVRLGCYAHGVKNFVGAILLFFTMVLPIILQFDHFVIATMSKSGSNALAVMGPTSPRVAVA